MNMMTFWLQKSPVTDAFRWRRVTSQVLGSIALCGLALSLGACNEHPVRRLDQALSASNRVENRLPAKTKLDFLFVIDNSSSMGEEQKALSDNFKTFSDFLFDELQGSADYRIAVTTSGVLNENAGCGVDQATSGAFVYQPADPLRPVSKPIVIVNNETLNPPPGVLPVTEDCFDSNSDPVISSDELNGRPESALPPPPAGDPACSDPSSAACLKVRRKLLLEKEFRCHSTLGTGGCTIEKGLEAMRLALSCGGPNADLFKACCINYDENDPEQNKYSYYNPACVIDDPADEPTFLRPDATLVVIFITDENDCSTPVDNPYASTRLICRPGWRTDANEDGVPDI